MRAQPCMCSCCCNQTAMLFPIHMWEKHTAWHKQQDGARGAVPPAMMGPPAPQPHWKRNSLQMHPVGLACHALGAEDGHIGNIIKPGNKSRRTEAMRGSSVSAASTEHEVT